MLLKAIALRKLIAIDKEFLRGGLGKFLRLGIHFSNIKISNHSFKEIKTYLKNKFLQIP